MHEGHRDLIQEIRCDPEAHVVEKNRTMRENYYLLSKTTARRDEERWKKTACKFCHNYFFYSMHCYRETEPKAQIGLETEKMCNFLVTCILHLVDLSIFIQKRILFLLFSALNLSFSGCSHAGSLFTNEERERLVRYVIYTFATHFGLVHIDCWAQKWHRSRSCFRDF